MMVSLTYVFAVLTLASGTLSAVRAQSSPDYAPFDPRRIGLPALTDAGIDHLIEEHRKLIEEGRKAIAELEPRRGELSNAEELIDRYRATISEEMGQITRLAGERMQRATELAEAGRAADALELATRLSTVVEASRLNAFLGNKEEALKQWQAVVKKITTFSQTFSKTCYDQSFDPAFALGLERQNEMLGTGIDLTPCAKRRHTFRIGTEGVYGEDWTNCSTSGEGKWEVKGDGSLSSGKGEGAVEVSGDGKSLEGSYTLTNLFKQMPVKRVQQGRMNVVVQENRAGDGTLIERNMTANIETASVTHYNSGGQVLSDARSLGWLPWPVKISDKPCRSEGK